MGGLFLPELPARPQTQIGLIGHSPDQPPWAGRTVNARRKTKVPARALSKPTRALLPATQRDYFALGTTRCMCLNEPDVVSVLMSKRTSAIVPARLVDPSLRVTSYSVLAFRPPQLPHAMSVRPFHLSPCPLGTSDLLALLHSKLEPAHHLRFRPRHRRDTESPYQRTLHPRTESHTGPRHRKARRIDATDCDQFQAPRNAPPVAAHGRGPEDTQCLVRGLGEDPPGHPDAVLVLPRHHPRHGRRRVVVVLRGSLESRLQVPA